MSDLERMVVERTPDLSDARDQTMAAARDRPNQMLAVRLLERQGYRVDVAAGGSEALLAIARQRYDLLFLDCFMPPGCRMPIIALTANVLPEDRQKCLDAGMDDILAKPINQDDLFAALMRWLPTSLKNE